MGTVSVIHPKIFARRRAWRSGDAQRMGPFGSWPSNSDIISLNLSDSTKTKSRLLRSGARGGFFSWAIMGKCNPTVLMAMAASFAAGAPLIAAP